ncbi:MAG: RtcB family protein [Acidithiobacillus sp.]
MIQIEGLHNTARCFCETLEKTALGQIKSVCDRSEFADCKIRIMPDVHAGKGCTIGTTMTITDKIVPSMVGVDIGCGMETVLLRETEIDFARLDQVIWENIPYGREVRQELHPLYEAIHLHDLRCAKLINLSRA